MICGTLRSAERISKLRALLPEMPNYRMNLTKVAVTARACARSAPATIAGYPGRWATNGHDVHITRGEDWSVGNKPEISLREWREYIRKRVSGANRRRRVNAARLRRR
jgi:hypothetical protein